MPTGQSEEEPLSVSAASGFARQKVSLWGEFWLEGEVAEWRTWQSIVFFTIKDETSRLSGKIDQSTITSANETVAVGDKIRLFGRFDVWPKNGEFKFIATAIRNKGLGDFIVSIEKLRVQLQSEGLFDESRKVPLPYLPLCIGLITAQDSDAEKDVITNARLRWSDVKFTTVYTPVSGDAAVAQIPPQSPSSMRIRRSTSSSLRVEVALSLNLSRSATSELSAPPLNASLRWCRPLGMKTTARCWTRLPTCGLRPQQMRQSALYLTSPLTLNR